MDRHWVKFRSLNEFLQYSNMAFTDMSVTEKQPVSSNFTIFVHCRTRLHIPSSVMEQHWRLSRFISVQYLAMAFKVASVTKWQSVKSKYCIIGQDEKSDINPRFGSS
eukprot:TRINITY_DN13029_c0_g1_i1.p2 TRINITY_DN13029_c0_g1~~TRINITY_DN13029_c0_g1_i1.p2  ORF type:complete len:107 (+),score=4.30 TRINITY_DN13029_c0_g1_i1:173-493(+)